MRSSPTATRSARAAVKAISANVHEQGGWHSRKGNPVVKNRLTHFAARYYHFEKRSMSFTDSTDEKMFGTTSAGDICGTVV